LDFSNDNYKEYKPEVFGDIMKMVFSVSPYGGCVNQAISIIEQKNTLKLLEEIKLRIDRLEECTKNTFVKNLYIKENFFYYALIKSKSCHYENQIERLAELVVNAMAEEVINIDDAEILIDIISEINTSEIELFKWISDSWYKSFVVENTKEIETWEIEKEIVLKQFANGDGLLYRLVSKGLLKEFIRSSGAFWIKQGTVNPDKIYYSFTYYGKLWVKIINGY